MATELRVDTNTRLIGGGNPLELVLNGKVPDKHDRYNVAKFIESACIHTDPSKCDDPLIRALYRFVEERDLSWSAPLTDGQSS